VPDGRLVFGRTVGLDGTLGPEVKLGGSSLWQVGAQVAGSGGNGKFLVAWGDYDLNPGIDAGYRARVLDASGQPASAILELARYGDQIYEAPAIAWQPCKRAWLVAQTRQQKIFGTWIGLDGTILANDLLLAESSVGAGAPRLVYSPAAHAFGLVYHAWQIEDGYLQELDAGGTGAGAPQSINQQEPSLGTFWNPLATRPDRKELVVLSAPRPRHADGSVFRYAMRTSMRANLWIAATMVASLSVVNCGGDDNDASGSGGKGSGGKAGSGGNGGTGGGSGSGGTGAIASNIIPADRLPPPGTWESAGVEGGIPERSTVCADVTKAPYGADPTGATSAVSAIQSAIDACPENQVVFVPAGSYLIDARIQIKKPISLRGAGATTIFQVTANSAILIGGSGLLAAAQSQ
jgi:hypothetical protein